MSKRNTPSARVMRQAVAYDRLAAKAYRAGNIREFTAYGDKSIRLRAQANRMREREEARRAV